MLLLYFLWLALCSIPTTLSAINNTLNAGVGAVPDPYQSEDFIAFNYGEPYLRKSDIIDWLLEEMYPEFIFDVSSIPATSAPSHFRLSHSF